jgi:hypothetical protein
MNGRIPHLRIVVAVSAFVLFGFAVVSAYVIGWGTDEVTKGNIIGTWQNFALLAVGFWIGSSSAGKAKDGEPVQTEVVNAPDKPVPTTVDGASA